MDLGYLINIARTFFDFYIDPLRQFMYMCIGWGRIFKFIKRFRILRKVPMFSLFIAFYKGYVGFAFVINIARTFFEFRSIFFVNLDKCILVELRFLNL